MLVAIIKAAIGKGRSLSGRRASAMLRFFEVVAALPSLARKLGAFKVLARNNACEYLNR